VKRKTKTNALHSFLFFSLFLLFSCGEPDLKEQALQIFDSNETSPSESKIKSKNLLRSADGLQFTKVDKHKNTAQTVGLTKNGSVSFEGKMKNGKPEGAWTTFFPDGRPRWKGKKKDGLNHGPFTMWYPEGLKKMEGVYENGKKHGLSTMWHLNGAKWKEQHHYFGSPIGNWRTWNNQGEMIENINHGQPDKN
jgi:antitoxin component YwqK of YwqJK toxin-antitoxin module